MLTAEQRQRLRALQQSELDGILSPEEQTELQAFVQQIEAEEATLLHPAMERMRHERREIEEQNTALAALIRRKERLARRLERILALSTAVCAAMVCLLGAGIAYGADDVKSVPVPAVCLLWDAHSHRIYASVPASATNAGNRGNTVTVINPDTGEVVSSTFVGPEPNRMALSLSGKYLFIGVDGADSVRVYDIAKQAAGLQISLGAGLTASDLSAVPGYPDSVAVERRNRASSPSESGLMIYGADGSTHKNTVNAGHSLLYDPMTGRMYGFENEISSYGLRTVIADDNGPVEVDYHEGLLNGNLRLIAAQNGLLFSDSAEVLDPVNLVRLGQYPGYGYGSVVAPDATTGKVYFATDDRNGITITAFDMYTFTPVGKTVIAGVKGSASCLIRWGNDGLAFATSNGQVWIVRNSLVGPKQAPVDLAVTATGLPDMFPVNQVVTCTITATNLGTTPATGVVLSDRLSSNVDIINVAGTSGPATFANGAARVEVQNLAPKAKAVLTVQLRLKPQDSTQEHPLTAVTQAAFVRSKEPDTTPSNNHLAQVARLQAEGPAAMVAGVDLTGAWKSLAQMSDGAGADLQATVQGEFEVRNNGTQPAPPTRIRFFLAADRVYDPAFAQLLQESGVPELKPGGTYRVTLKARLPKGDDAIGLFVIAIVNATNTVEETNKKNNILPGGPIP